MEIQLRTITFTQSICISLFQNTHTLSLSLFLSLLPSLPHTHIRKNTHTHVTSMRIINLFTPYSVRKLSSNSRGNTLSPLSNNGQEKEGILKRSDL